MKTAFVLTGVTDRKTQDASPIRPDYVFESIANLESLLRYFRLQLRTLPFRLWSEGAQKGASPACN
jgi:hypothetical protein